VVERINAAMAKVLASATIRERLAAQGVEPRPLTPDAFAKLIAEDYETMSKVVKVVGKVE
jgi:tripartite-type tricarboxylate transporter receptor subunit TctC